MSTYSELHVLSCNFAHPDMIQINSSLLLPFKSITLLQQISNTAICCIPETPLPWNATGPSALHSSSAHDIAKYPVVVQHQKVNELKLPLPTESSMENSTQSKRQHSWSHVPRPTARKTPQFWKRKIQKHQDSSATEVSATDTVGDSGPEAFLKPLPPKPAASVSKLTGRNRDNLKSASFSSSTKGSKWHDLFSRSKLN